MANVTIDSVTPMYTPDGQTDRQTDRRMTDSFVDTASLILCRHMSTSISPVTVQMGPRYTLHIVLYTDVNAECDNLAKVVVGRPSQELST